MSERSNQGIEPFEEGKRTKSHARKGAMAYPLSTHAYALSSHFVYGLTAEVVRRAIRGAL